MLMLYVALAHAGEIELWADDSFGRDGDLAGNNDWTNGYSDDLWYSYDNRAYSMTDDRYSGDFDAYGQDTAADNWMIRGEEVRQGVVRIEWGSDDDDAVGLVSNHDGDDSFYMLVYSEDSVPPPLYETDDRPELILYRVEGGDAKVLKRVRAAYARTTNDLSLEIDDGVLTATLNEDTFFAVEDTSPLPAGQGGMYAYNSGEDGGNSSSYCWISSIEVSYVDEDDDGIPDDTDNCENVSNPGQADWNDNGIGDACGDPEPEDTDEPVDTSVPDTGTGGTGVPSGLTGNIELEAMSCGCSSSSSRSGSRASWGGLVVLLGLVLRRRS
jgi:MYXO-CTERM domain-containing protein